MGYPLPKTTSVEIKFLGPDPWSTVEGKYFQKIPFNNPLVTKNRGLNEDLRWNPL